VAALVRLARDLDAGNPTSWAESEQVRVRAALPRLWRRGRGTGREDYDDQQVQSPAHDRFTGFP
jgi:hypothetical protein